MSELLIRSKRLLTPRGLRPASLLVRDGTIAKIHSYGRPFSGPTFDAGNRAVIPGLVDTHVHVNEPGRAEWEGFDTATKAAAAGGVTTIVDMPLNSIPVTTSAAALKAKLAAAKGRCWVDCGFWGGLVPGNEAEIEPLIAAGALGFKAFLIHSGIDDFPAVSEDDLRKSMGVLAARGVPLLAHAELACAPAAPGPGDARRYARYLASRPRSWENDAVRLLIALAEETGCRVHIVHLSSAEALDLLARARRKRVPVTAETCPHYLCFAAEDIPDGATQFKCAPPIRERANREKLWTALDKGVIDFIVSDHSPCLPELKRQESGDFMAAWGGISSLQFGLSAVWTRAKSRDLTLEDVARWMCERPARWAGLERKGRLEPGYDADLVVFDPEAEFTVEASLVRHRHALTPYLGQKLAGAVSAVFLRGTPVTGTGAPAGKFLLNSDRRIASL